MTHVIQGFSRLALYKESPIQVECLFLQDRIQVHVCTEVTTVSKQEMHKETICLVAGGAIISRGTASGGGG